MTRPSNGTVSDDPACAPTMRYQFNAAWLGSTGSCHVGLVITACVIDWALGAATPDVVTAELFLEPMHEDDPYMIWYHLSHDVLSPIQHVGIQISSINTPPNCIKWFVKYSSFYWHESTFEYVLSNSFLPFINSRLRRGSYDKCYLRRSWSVIDTATYSFETGYLHVTDKHVCCLSE